MDINEFVDILLGFWNVLWNFKIFNISIVVWASIPLIVKIIFDFVQGKKGGKDEE